MYYCVDFGKSGLVCTLERGHTGEHVAHLDVARTIVADKWGAPEPEPILDIDLSFSNVRVESFSNSVDFNIQGNSYSLSPDQAEEFGTVLLYAVKVVKSEDS